LFHFKYRSTDSLVMFNKLTKVITCIGSIITHGSVGKVTMFSNIFEKLLHVLY